ncbi:MAG: lysophospholipid acyltransferase family protein [Robiginitomaculum sp.]
MSKSILRAPAFIGFVAIILAFYMAFIKRTTRWAIEGENHIAPLRAGGGGLILCVWHGRFFLSNSGWHKGDQPASVLVSKSNDGSIITAAAQKLGLGVIRGSGAREGNSKDRGGAGALREMVRHLRAKGCMVITPDGPRGPRMRAGLGPLSLAKMTGAPIVPYALSTRNRKLMKSWDRFMFPFPFGRGAIVWGEPIYIPRKANPDEMETLRAQLESAMIAVTNRADALTGKEIIQPSDIAKIARNDG